MIQIIFDAIHDCMVTMWGWLTYADAFQKIADSVEVGYVCLYCGKRRGRFEYCQECGADSWQPVEVTT